MTEYYARVNYTYQGGDRNFSIPFSYIDKGHIKVLVNSEEIEDYTYLNNSQIQIDETLTSGDLITIIRTTPINERMVVYSDTSILNKDNQNLAQEQMFDSVQEIHDNLENHKEDVETLKPYIKTAAENIEHIIAVNENEANINIVADSTTDINTVSDNITNINAVADNTNNIDAVADNITNINAVNANKTNIDTVAGNNTNINAVADNQTNINSVANSITDVNTVADNISNINAVKSNESNINSVVSNSVNINAVSSNISNITTVRNNINKIGTVADNINIIDSLALEVDRIDQSKGKKSGTISNNQDILNDVKYYSRSTFDRNKFTVVGTPNITDDGIISDISASDYVYGTFSSSFDTANTWQICERFKVNSLNVSQRLYQNKKIATENGNSIIIQIETSGAMKIFLSNSSTGDIANGVSLNYTASLNEILDTTLKFTGSSYEFYVNGNKTWEKTSNTKVAAQNSLYIFTGASGTGVSTGNQDLKYFSVEMDGIPVFSGNQTGIDTIKPDNYTVVGSPTISTDGVASGFSSGNYLAITTGINASDTNYEIDIPFLKTANNTVIASTTVANSGNQSFALIYTNGHLLLYLGTGSSWDIADTTAGTTNCQNNKQYIAKLIRTSTQYIVKLLNIETGVETTEITVDSTTDLSSISALYLGTPSYWSSLAYNTVYNLNLFKIYVDGNLVYQPCLKIPYTLSKTGSKIVDSVYRSRVEDMYGQFGYAPYYTLSDTDFTLPQGELYGMMRTLTDGQWVYKYALVAEDVAWSTNTPEATYSLSSYLPNDGYDYEVLFAGSVHTGTTSGDFCTLSIMTDIMTSSVPIAHARTRTTADNGGQGNGILPVGQGRYVKQYSTSSANANGTYTLMAKAYRRIGKNS